MWLHVLERLRLCACCWKQGLTLRSGKAAGHSGVGTCSLPLLGCEMPARWTPLDTFRGSLCSQPGGPQGKEVAGLSCSPCFCRDRQERTPYCVSADKPTRNTFRKFMVDHPDKYDYGRAKVHACPRPLGDPGQSVLFLTRSCFCSWELLTTPNPCCPQVPGPLTLEMEAKKLEKKRAQKAQRKQREQAQREERQRWEQEEGEKQRFAALSDREKVMPGTGKGIQPGWGSADAVGSSTAGLGGLTCLLLPRGPWLLSGGWLNRSRTGPQQFPTSGTSPGSWDVSRRVAAVSPGQKCSLLAARPLASQAPSLPSAPLSPHLQSPFPLHILIWGGGA